MSLVESLMIINDVEKMLDEKISKKLESKLDGKPTQIEMVEDTDPRVIMRRETPWFNDNKSSTWKYSTAEIRRASIGNFIYEFYCISSSGLSIYITDMTSWETIEINSTAFTDSVYLVFVWNGFVYVQIGTTLYRWDGRLDMTATFSSVITGLNSGAQAFCILDNYVYISGIRTGGSDPRSLTGYKLDLSAGTKTSLSSNVFPSYVNSIYVDGDIIYAYARDTLYSTAKSNMSNSSVSWTSLASWSTSSYAENYSGHIIKLGNCIYVTRYYNILNTSNPLFCYIPGNSTLMTVCYFSITASPSSNYIGHIINDAYPIYTDDGRVFVCGEYWTHYGKRSTYGDSDTIDYKSQKCLIELFLYDDDRLETVGFHMIRQGLPFDDNFYTFIHNGEIYFVRMSMSYDIPSNSWTLVKYNKDNIRGYDIVYCSSNTRNRSTSLNTVARKSKSYSDFKYFNGKLYVVDDDINLEGTISYFRCGYIDLLDGTYHSINPSIESNSQLFLFRGELYLVKSSWVVYRVLDSELEEICSGTNLGSYSLGNGPDRSHPQPYGDKVYFVAKQDSSYYLLAFDGTSIGQVSSSENYLANSISVSSDHDYYFGRIFQRGGSSHGIIARSKISFSNIDPETGDRFDMNATWTNKDTKSRYWFDWLIEVCGGLNSSYIYLNNNVIEYEGKSYFCGYGSIVEIIPEDTSKLTSMYLQKGQRILTDKRYVYPVRNLKEIDDGYEVLETGRVDIGEVYITPSLTAKTIL